MEELVLVITVLAVGYVLGVWTACVIFRQPQREYEEAARASVAPLGVLVAIGGDPPQPPRRRR